MLKTIFGFSKKNKEIYIHRIRCILIDELGINVEHKTNPNFPGYMGYIDHIDRYFYKKRTPEHCGVGLALMYWENLLETGAESDFREAKGLKPKLIKVINTYSKSGLLFPELTIRLNTVITNFSQKYQL